MCIDFEDSNTVTPKEWHIGYLNFTIFNFSHIGFCKTKSMKFGSWI